MMSLLFKDFLMVSRAARQSQILSAGGNFDVLGYADHENHNKKILKKLEPLVQWRQKPVLRQKNRCFSIFFKRYYFN